MPKIRHVVLMKLQAETPADEIAKIFSGVADLQGVVDGFLASSGGPYSSNEGLHQDFTHGFSVDFASPSARDAYLEHPQHEPVKQRILQWLDGGLETVIAFDWEYD